MKNGFQSINSRLDTIETNQEIQGDTVRDVAKRMTETEIRISKFEDRANLNSLRAKHTSDVDLKHDAAISSIMTDVANLKETQTTQLDILKRLDAVAANPMVRRIAYILASTTLSYLAIKGWIVK